ncbi:tandem-95 repeat protein [Candidatus Woesearchaeota archaeon]|nr:tandem-95 repeat protein [Candidatus Woesearchaeota archaeon]
MNADGSFTYAPNANFNGVDTFTYKANDGTADSAVNATVTITVNAVNDAPVASAQTVSTNEDTAKAITLTGTDIDANPLTFAVITCKAPDSGLLSGLNANTGAVTYTPNLNFNGADTFGFKVNDGTADSACATVTVNVVSGNDAPTVTNKTLTTNEDSAGTVNVAGTDPDGDALTYSIVANASNGACAISGATLTYTPVANFNGTDSCTFKANDGILDSGTATVSITVNAVDDPPVLAAIGAKSVAENAALSFNISATDADGNAITYSALNLPAGASLNASSGALTWTPSFAQAGIYNVTFKATANSVEASEVVAITVSNTDRAPVLSAIGSKSATENALLSFNISATDADGDSITYSAVNLPAGATLNASTGAFAWTPSYTQAGTYNVTFKATANSVEASEAVAITVANTDRAPVLAAIGNKSGTESSALTFAISATDDDNDVVAYSAIGLPSGSSLNTSSGTFTWTPSYSQAGTYEVTFKASANGAEDSEVISIVISNTDRAPTLSAIGNKTGSENTAMSFTISASDPDNDAVTYSATNLPSGATLDASIGVFIWTPSFAQAGTYNVTFKASAGGIEASEVVVITVSNTDRAPVLALVNNQSVNENSALTFSLSATDADGDSINYGAVTLPQGASLNAASGAFAWTPSYDQAGSYNITFTATANGASDTKSATIIVSNTNRLPTATSQDVSTNEDTAKAITLAGSDPDGSSLTYTIVNQPQYGSLSGSGASRIYTPGTNFNGSDIFTFKVNDGTADSAATAAVNITVVSVNDAPTAISQSVSTNEDTAVNITISAIDVEGSSLTYTIVSNPAKGTLSGSGATKVYTPGANQYGSDSFTFMAYDGASYSNVATVMITIASVADDPVLASIGDRSVNEGSSLSFMISATDGDGDSLYYMVEGSLPGAGSSNSASFNNSTHIFSWTPNYNQSGSYQVMFIVRDPSNKTDSETITITVGNSNRPPTITSISNKTVNEGQQLNFTISATDQDGDTLTYGSPSWQLPSGYECSTASMPSGAELNSSTGVFTWTPSYNQAGTYCVMFKVEDNGSPTHQYAMTSPVTITVGNVNATPVLASIGNKTVSENSALTFVISATDPDNNNLTYSMTSVAGVGASALPATATFDASTHAFTWTPTNGNSGTYAATFTAIDDGSPHMSTYENITITVTDVNRAPVLSAVSSLTTTVGSAATFTLAASDPDGGSLTYSATGLPAGAAVKDRQ